MPAIRKPILCLDFDGTLHHYTSGWKGADVVTDPPTPGAEDALGDYINAGFDIQILSARSHQNGGRQAMQDWARTHFHSDVWCELGYPVVKPPALVSLDDRALTFTGVWPKASELKRFRPWNKPQDWPVPKEPGLYWALYRTKVDGWEPVRLTYAETGSAPLVAHRLGSAYTWPLSEFTSWGPELTGRSIP